MSQPLFGSASFQGRVREQAVNFIDNHRSMFQDAVVAIVTADHDREQGMRPRSKKEGMSEDVGRVFDRYIRNIKRNRTWGIPFVLKQLPWFITFM